MHFTRAHLEGLLAANWPVAARLVAWARALAGLAAETLPKHVLLEARSILRPAESFIRRLIVIMACRITLAPAAFRVGAGAPRNAAPFVPRTQSLRPLGPAESLSVSAGSGSSAGPGAFAYPGLWAPGMLRYTPPSPEDLRRAPMPAAHFFARLAKLEAVIAAPQAAALRLARWMARRGAGLRRLPIRPWGLMPGRNAQPLDRLTRDRITYTAWAAQAALGEGAWNSS